MRQVLLGSGADEALFDRVEYVVHELSGRMNDIEWKLGGSDAYTRYEIVLPDGKLEALVEVWGGFYMSGEDALVSAMERRILKSL